MASSGWSGREYPARPIAQGKLQDEIPRFMRSWKELFLVSVSFARMSRRTQSLMAFGKGPLCIPGSAVSDPRFQVRLPTIRTPRLLDFVTKDPMLHDFAKCGHESLATGNSL